MSDEVRSQRNRNANLVQMESSNRLKRKKGAPIEKVVCSETFPVHLHVLFEPEILANGNAHGFHRFQRSKETALRLKLSEIYIGPFNRDETLIKKF